MTAFAVIAAPAKDVPVPQRVYIRDFEPTKFIDGVFAVQNCQLGQTKSGKPYIKCLLADKTGRTPARMWNANEDLFRKLPTDGFVWIAGQTQPYQGEMQVILKDIRPHEPTRQDLTELLPTTENNIDEMFAEVLRVLQTLKHPALRALAERYLEDGDLMDKFCQAPAAMTLHHAYLGGLLEHTLNLLRLADGILPLYPQLNRDLILFGLFLHDLGKCAELTWEKGFRYTDEGQLIGHIALGLLWLEEKAKACQQLPTGAVRIPKPILRVLGHIILSHHGQPQFGAVKIPATAEAIAISIIDNLDAKLNMALAAIRSDQAGAGSPDKLGGQFTERIWALDTKLYRPDPMIVEET